MTLPPSILRYWLAMNASAFDAAVQSVAGFGSAASAHVAAEDFGVTIPALHVEQLLLVFLGAFAWGILKYLTAHPVSDLVPDIDDALGRLARELAKEPTTSSAQPATHS